MGSKGRAVRINGVSAVAPGHADIVGKSLLARFRYHKTASVSTVAVLYGHIQSDEQARRIIKFMTATGFVETRKQSYGPSMQVVLASQWNSWEEAYHTWCQEWKLETVEVAS